jgi:hypothetical protein
VTDLEKLLALLDDFGIDNVTVSEVQQRFPVGHRGPDDGQLIDAVSVELTADNHTKVTGYPTFIACFDFTPAGEFLELGVFE